MNLQKVKCKDVFDFFAKQILNSKVEKAILIINYGRDKIFYQTLKTF